MLDGVDEQTEIGFHQANVVFKNDGTYEIKNQPCSVGINLWNEFKLGTDSDLLKFDRSYDDILFKSEFLDNFVTYRIYKMLKYRNKYIKPPIYLKNSPNDNYSYILKILKIFLEKCKTNKNFPIILLLDNKNTFADRVNFAEPWKNIINDLKEMGFFVVEPLENIYSLYMEDPNSIINHDGIHYTPLANEMVKTFDSNVLLLTFFHPSPRHIYPSRDVKNVFLFQAP